jgi:DNA-binding transcriptional ArsR family regulator
VPKTSNRHKARDAADAVAHAVAHPIRVDILSILQEGGTASQKELASQLHQPLGNITHHINELKESKAIEIAYTKKVGNVDQHYWRAIKTSTYEPDELAELTTEEHEGLSRIIVQSIIAEALASLRAGRLAGDPYAATAWDRLRLDEEGYKDLNENTQVFFNRVYEIAAESAIRMAETGEEGNVYIASVMVFERGRHGPNTTLTVGHLGEESLSSEESLFENLG